MNNENIYNLPTINDINNSINIIHNCNGTNLDKSITSNNFMDISPIKEILSENMENNINNNTNNINKNTNINIYRYKFSNLFTEQLFSFSKIHQYDDRASFKDAWKEWVKENNDFVEIEIRRLTNLEYEGDILDKMFKSARYYFRKKNTCINEPKKRGTYLSIQKEILDAMDKHISTSLVDTKPSDRFDNFCIQYQIILKEEIMRLMNEKSHDAEEIKKKIKKTYKNRYFLYNNKK